MLKIGSLLLTSLALFVISMLSGPDKNNVSIEQRLPRTVIPGEKFLVSITINKGDNVGFARLLQTLPEGYTAEPVDTKNAQFMVAGQDIKFIWTELPASPTLTVSYTVIPPAVQGNSFHVGGLFSYIHDDETTRLPVAVAEVAITSASGPSPEAAVSRRMINVNPASGEFAVILTIHPVTTTSTTFIDRIPEGFSAESVDTYGATFSFDKHEARFVWTQLKDTASFNIMYKVKSGNPVEEAPVIEGMMVYGDPTQANDRESIATSKNTADEGSANQPVSKIGNNPSVVNPMAIDLPVVQSKQQQLSASSSQKGLAYKVQILATRRSPSRPTSWIREYYSINGNVETGQFEGWNKYSIGTFPTYREASVAKVHARQSVKDAFVVAYQNGSRIPVPQALRIEQMNQ